MIKKLVHWWFTPLQGPFRSFRTIAWWEVRRLPFNVAAGLVAAACLAIYYKIVDAYPPFTEAGSDAIEVVAPLGVAIAIGVNVAYTFGWVIEVVLRLFNPDRWGSLSASLMWTLILLIWAALPAICWFDYKLTLWINLSNST